MNTLQLKNNINRVTAQGIIDSVHRDILHVDWAITSTCNYKCSYCFSPSKPQYEEFSLERMMKTIDNLLRLNRPFYSFRLVGGEPTQNPYLPNIIQYILKNKNCAILLTTNACKTSSYFADLFTTTYLNRIEVHISIHLEYANYQHIEEVIQSIIKAGNSVFIRLMLHPQLFQKAKQFHKQLTELRLHIPFTLQIRMLRQPPDFIFVDKRYNQEYFEWIQEADVAFGKAVSKGQTINNTPDWGQSQYILDHNDLANDNCSILHNEAMREGLTNFNNFFCCAGINVLNIAVDYTFRGAVCPLFGKSYNHTIDSIPLSSEKLYKIIKCCYNNCGCDANDMIPKFRKLSDAQKYLYNFILRARMYEKNIEKPINISNKKQESIEIINSTKEVPITVLMPVFNEEEFLCDAIDSILHQTFHNFIFLIIDDASTDSTPEILARFAAQDSRIRIMTNQNTLGLTACLNKGLAEISTPYIARMDADDISLPLRLEKQHDFLREHPDVVVCSSFVEVFGDATYDIMHWFTTMQTYTAHDDIKKILLTGENCVIHSATMIRSNALIQIGGYRQFFQYAQDYDLWLRLLCFGKVEVLPEILLYYRWHGGSVSMSKKQEQSCAALAAIIAARMRNEWNKDPWESCEETKLLWKYVSSIINDNKNMINELKILIDSRENIINDKDKIIYDMKKNISEIENNMKIILLSRSWRITSPLRRIFAINRKLISRLIS
jgi:glycosyltransferase involved in cell wall biosynthesis/organic radical activating enzyme